MHMAGWTSLVVLAFVVGACVVLCSWFVWRDSSRSSRAVKHFDRGVQAQREANLLLAVEWYTKAIQADSRLPEPYLNRAIIYVDIGRLDEATSDCAKAIELSEDCAKRARSSGAEEASRKFVGIGARAFSVRGYVLAEQGELDKALADCNQAIELDPRHAGAYGNRGRVYWRKGEYNRAVADCTKAVGLDQNLCGAYVNRADAYLALGEYDKGIVDCNRAIELGMKDGALWAHRGELWNLLGDTQKAIADCDMAIHLQADLAGAYFERGRAWHQAGDYERAIRDYEEAIRLSPEIPQAYHCLARLLATCSESKFRDGQKALELATRACELSQWKGSSEITSLSAAHAEAGDFTGAANWLIKAMRMDKNETELRFEMLRHFWASTPFRGPSRHLRAKNG
jgi:tetratricopeptide (TPR) repeat protein